MYTYNILLNQIISDLSNNCKDIYGIILKDKIDSQNQNLKVTPPCFSKSAVGGADSGKSDFDFFLPNTKISFYIF